MIAIRSQKNFAVARSHEQSPVDVVEDRYGLDRVGSGVSGGVDAALPRKALLHRYLIAQVSPRVTRGDEHRRPLDQRPAGLRPLGRVDRGPQPQAEVLILERVVELVHEQQL
jgi:hypothetical protein